MVEEVGCGVEEFNDLAGCSVSTSMSEEEGRRVMGSVADPVDGGASRTRHREITSILISADDS